MKKSVNLTIMICLISLTLNYGYSLEKDSINFEKWKTISVKMLNKTAENLFKQNTSTLDSIGKEVQNYIK